VSRSGPIQWRPTKDAEILKAVERQADVHRRWVEAQAEARRAVEAISAARAADESRRADLVAAGKPDPGPKSLGEVEAAAEDAAGRRDVLGEGFKRARAAALDLASEREAAWTAASETALGTATGSLQGAIDVLATALDEWQTARNELVLAQSSSLRERGRPLTATMTVDRLRGVNGQAVALPDVIAALRSLAETPAPGDEPVEPEREPMTAEDRRRLTATGGILPGRE
jgi:hypothetical protein